MGSTQLYVGIDVHKRVQVSTILSLPVLKNKNNEWKKVKPILIKNNIKDYESLHKAIHRQAKDASSVSIAVDRTGSYSLPIVDSRFEEHRLLNWPKRTDTIPCICSVI